MKNILILFFVGISTSLSFAQDIIIKLSGQEISAKVIEIRLTDILYIYPDSLPETYLSIPISEVFMIKYANGTREVFKENLPENTVQNTTSYTPEEMYNWGRQDARTYYRANGALWGSAASSLVFPYGLAGPIIIGAVPPNIKTNDMHNLNLANDESYMRGYKKQAHNKKIGNAVAGAAIGTATIFTIAITVLMAAWSY